MDWEAFLTETSEAFRDAIERRTVPRHYEKGALVFDQGDFDDRLFILDSGLLEVSVVSERGKKLALNQLRPHSLFGEIALFDPGARTARVEALEPSDVRSLSKSELLAAIRSSPEILPELLSLTGKRMRWISSQVEAQVFQSPAERLADKILYLMDDENRVQMSQGQLADYVGVSREVVSRLLADWQRKGIVKVSRGAIETLDEEALQSIQNQFL